MTQSHETIQIDIKSFCGPKPDNSLNQVLEATLEKGCGWKCKNVETGEIFYMHGCHDGLFVGALFYLNFDTAVEVSLRAVSEMIKRATP